MATRHKIEAGKSIGEDGFGQSLAHEIGVPVLNVPGTWVFSGVGDL